MTSLDFFIRIFAAFLLGIVIGIERQYRHRMAGIQTNALVCVGSCLFVMFSSLQVTGDKTRIAAQVVTGVGFLGGGVILREGFNVKGLNTAATLWCTAAIGVLVSAGYIAYSAIGASIIVMSNMVLRPLGRRIYNMDAKTVDEECIYTINIKCIKKEEFKVRSQFMNMVSEENILLRNLESDITHCDDIVLINASIICYCKNDNIIEKIISKIGLENGVLSVGWEVS